MFCQCRGWLVLIGRRDIASGRTQEKTPLPTVPLLLHGVAIDADRIENTAPSRTFIGDFAWRDAFHCCATVYILLLPSNGRICKPVPYQGLSLLASQT
jgi:hypothetical protein